MTGRPAVFLDRDGVLDDATLVEGRPRPPVDRSALRIPPEAAPALARLRAAGFALVCITNQPDVARGTTTRAEVDAINDEVRRRLDLDDLLCCFHDTPDRCPHRKPAPGALLHAAAHHDLHLAASTMVGDRWSDVEAGRRAGCRTILIGDGYGEDRAASGPPDVVVASLPEAVEAILGWRR